MRRLVSTSGCSNKGRCEAPGDTDQQESENVVDEGGMFGHSACVKRADGGGRFGGQGRSRSSRRIQGIHDPLLFILLRTSLSVMVMPMAHGLAKSSMKRRG